MVRLILLVCGMLLSASAIQASTFKIGVDSGSVVIHRTSSQIKEIITDSSTISTGDSLLLAAGNQAVVRLETYSRLICKGPLSMAFSGENISLKIALEGEGQIFLDRKKPYDIGFIEIVTKGFVFRPIGTAAAIKPTGNGNPSTAVLEGKMNMQAPDGDVIVVLEGNYGTIGSKGKLVSEKLSPSAIESLQQWVSGASGNDGSQVEQATAQSSASNSTAVPPAQVPPVTPEKNVPSETESKDTDRTSGQGETSDKKDDKKQQEIEKNPVSEPTTATGDGATPQWEIGAGVVTVDNENWTRIALGVDVPIWKFGVFFDLELFVDNNGNISNKGWDFKNEPLEAVTRKIRYIRFGQEQDPLFIKFGGLSSVTLGYGFLVDRFTNMLHYPDQKQLGLQFNLNDLTPIGLTLQTVLADFKDFDNDGGVFGARLAFKPLKMSPIPIVNGIQIGATYASDLNQYAPARKWDYTLRGPESDRDLDGTIDGTYVEDMWHTASDTLTQSQRIALVRAGKYDTLVEHQDQWASRENEQFGLIGGDIGIPLISSSIVNLDLYGQAGIRDDGNHGWGIGAPGIALKVWQIWAGIEYRHVRGRFTPGYFNRYYLDERIIRNKSEGAGASASQISIKEDRIPDDELNGVFGKLGFNIANVLIIDGVYQYMVGKNEENTDQRFEATASIGDLIVQKIPKVNKVEAYFVKSAIGNYALKIDPLTSKITYDSFFEETPFMYYGYRLGFEISEGASLIWDARYGFKADKNGKMKENNFISVQTAITF